MGARGVMPAQTPVAARGGTAPALAEPGATHPAEGGVLAFATDHLTHPDGRSYGANLDAWQADDFAAASGQKHVWLERPRAHSKTQDMAVAALADLFTGPGRRGFFAACDQDQAALAYDSLRGFVHRSDRLSSVLRLERTRVIAPAIDSTVEVLAADAPGSWGLRPSFVGCDELSQWRGDRAEQFFYALYSALGKVPGAKMLVSTTAGWDYTSLCWKLRENIRTDPAWTFSRIGQVASWVSGDFLEQQRRVLPEHVYRMLHLNEWTDAGGAFLTRAEVDGLFDAGLAEVAECRAGQHFVGLDLGLSHDATVAAVLHEPVDGRVVVHAVRSWRGSPSDRVRLDDVEDWVRDAARRFTASQVIADPWQAVGLIQRLQAGGLSCADVVFSATYRNRLFANLLELIRARKLVSYPHPALKDELLGLSFHEAPGGLRVDHAGGGHDDHAMACAMAALAAVELGARPRWGAWP